MSAAQPFTAEEYFAMTVAADKRREAREAAASRVEVKSADVLGEAGRFGVIEAREFTAHGLAEPEWLVDEVLPRHGIGMFFGASGSHKTTCVLDLMTAHHRGADWRSRQTTRGRGVLVVAEGERHFKFHMLALARHLNCDVSELPAVVPSPVNLLHGEQVREFLAELQRLGASHVCFDTKQQCSVGADENAVKEQGTLISNMKFLSRELNAFVSCTHHTGHGDQTRGRGSSVWQPAVDAEYSFKFDPAQKTGVMECTKLKEGERGTVFPFEQKIIELGVSRKTGKPYGSVVIVHSEVPAHRPRVVKLTGVNQREVEPAIRSLGPDGTAVSFSGAIDAALLNRGVKPARADKDERRRMKNAFLEVRDLGRITIDVEADTCCVGRAVQDNTGWENT